MAIFEIDRDLVDLFENEYITEASTVRFPVGGFPSSVSINNQIFFAESVSEQVITFRSLLGEVRILKVFND